MKFNIQQKHCLYVKYKNNYVTEREGEQSTNLDAELHNILQ